MRSTAVGAVLWVLLLEATVRKTCAYVARAPFPRFSRRARPGQSLEMGATSGLIEVLTDGVAAAPEYLLLCKCTNSRCTICHVSFAAEGVFR